MKTLQPVDFPLVAKDGHVHRFGGEVFLGPVPEDFAADLVERLNRDAAVQAVSGAEQLGEDPSKVMMVGPDLALST